MPKYQNIGGNSDIDSYEIADDSITITFRDGDQWLYNYQRPGADTVERMKLLAESGQGLRLFINTNVSKSYAAKLK